jgi:hypothetical protein
MHMSCIGANDCTDPNRQTSDSEQRDKRRDGDDRQDDCVCADAWHEVEDFPTQP